MIKALAYTMMVVATRLAAGHTRHICLKDGDIPISLH